VSERDPHGPEGQLPPKMAGRHRWIVLGTYTVTEGQARTIFAGDDIVALGPHNLVSTGIGCVDCELEWPVEGSCTAGAAPEMDDVTGTGHLEMDEATEEGMMAAIDAIARSGAKELEVGHLDDDVPSHLARWYATATYHGAKQSSQDHPDPLTAAEGLMAKLIVGGRCVACGQRIILKGWAGDTKPKRCVWHRVATTWVPGCIDDIDSFVASRRRPR
jgi:hypothetical protein